ncbi:hypothetical protein niasHS_000686 [Heterodera schachtii]|uniref:Uncharacterized protein n=1 Tax=Heterodera schachtii TaxID=97005 RepID=A0ABD2K4Y1_HETSC
MDPIDFQLNGDAAEVEGLRQNWRAESTAHFDGGVTEDHLDMVPRVFEAEEAAPNEAAGAARDGQAEEE